MLFNHALGVRGTANTQHGCNWSTWTGGTSLRILLSVVVLVTSFLMPWNLCQAELMVYIKVGTHVFEVSDGDADDTSPLTDDIIVDFGTLNSYFQDEGVTFSSNMIIFSQVVYDEDNLQSWIRTLSFQWAVTNDSTTNPQTVEVIATFKGANIGPSLPGFDRTMFLNASGNFGTEEDPATDPTLAKFAAIFDTDQTVENQNGNYLDSSLNPYAIGQDAGYGLFNGPTYSALRNGLTPTQIVNGDVDGMYSLMLASRVTLDPLQLFDTSAEASFLVPEPASFAMWGLGAAIALKRLRRKK